MLKLRRGVVVDTDPLTVQIDGERRPAWADSAMVGEVADGDEVVVNTEAADLGLGSGGFDVVHLNLTRGLDGPGPAAGEHVMKLNYTSLQHPVEPVETPEAASSDLGPRRLPPGPRPAAPRPPGAERVGGGPRAAGYPARLRPDARRRAPRGAVAGCCAASRARAARRSRDRGSRRMAASTRRSRHSGRCTPPPAASSGTRSSAGPARGYSARPRCTAMAGWRRWKAPMPRWRWVCRRSSLHGSRPRTRARGIAASAITPRPFSSLVLGSVRVPVPEIRLAGWPTGEEDAVG